MNEYFSHDYKARNDPKLVRLMMRHGLSGIGAYWCVVEMLYESGGYIAQREYERIAFELRAETDVIKSVIEDFDLFVFKSKRFYSKTVLARLQKRVEKSEKARQSVISRWTKNKSFTDVQAGDTNVLPPPNGCSTIKEEIKGKENKENNTSPISSPEREKDLPTNNPKQEKEKSCAKKERNIIPPTPEMVARYCQERKNGIIPSVFMDHYASKGWHIGKDRMIDWQAAVRTWEQKNGKELTQNTKQYGNV